METVNPTPTAVQLTAEEQAAHADTPTTHAPSAEAIAAEREAAPTDDTLTDAELRAHYGPRYDDAVELLAAGKTRDEVDAMFYAPDPIKLDKAADDVFREVISGGNTSTVEAIEPAVVDSGKIDERE